MQPVERSNPDGVDYGWVMQTTFVTTILVGSPIVALLSLNATLPTWGDKAEFAIRVGAVIWFLTALAVYVYAKRTDAGDGGTKPDDDINPEKASNSDSTPTASESESDAGAGD
ncbi:DUF5822 domain-containing protein [Haloferax larsenii]|uniref:Peptidoglycan-binding protein n=1 Tax=Haloferax larsenii TaxID=302484 RepID=A0A1H7RZE6_HALLR|nr:DUF5822 domain-containing protein [Haloferax larsenii]SEL65044.1 hypothetical protein SAMN04488691_106212 [Haloferax larsenii]